jgi:hypothetical protein
LLLLLSGVGQTAPQSDAGKRPAMEYGSMARRLHLKKMRFKDPGTLSTLLIAEPDDEEETQVVEVMPSRQDDVDSGDDDYVVTVNMFGDDGLVVHDDESVDSVDLRSEDDDEELHMESNIDEFLQDFLEKNKNRLKVVLVAWSFMGE